MTIIQDFQALQTGEQIGVALAVASIILIGLHCAWAEFTAWCDRQPIYDPLVHGPEDQKEIAAKHVEKRMPKIQSTLSKREMKAAFHGDPGGWKGIADAAVRKAIQDATNAPPRYQAGMLQNNPGYVPRGIENSDEARRMNAAIERQMAADTIKGKRP